MGGGGVEVYTGIVPVYETGRAVVRRGQLFGVGRRPRWGLSSFGEDRRFSFFVGSKLVCILIHKGGLAALAPFS